MLLVLVSYRSFTHAFTPHTTTTTNSFYKAAKLYYSTNHSARGSSSSSGRSALFAAEKARIVFLGTPDVAATSLIRLVAESKKASSLYEIVGVVTQPPKRRKRRGKEMPSPVGIAAEELEIPVLSPEKAKDVDFLTELEEVYKPDLCITAAYGNYLPKRFLKIPKFGTLNIHPSLLPRWRGASPVQRSLEAGDNPVGVSVLFTVSKMDAGPIVKQVEEEIDEDIDSTMLLPRLFDIGTDLLIDALPEVIEGKITMNNALVQDEEKVVNADMIDSSEGELFVWKDSARSCHDKLRGFSMWPGTFLYVRVGDAEDAEPVKMKIIKSRVLAESGADVTDEIVMGPEKKDGLRLVCGDGSVLELLIVQPVTRKAMDAKSYVNGLRGETVRWVKMPEPVEE